MKKLLVILLIIAGTLSLVSCADDHTSDFENTVESTAETTALTETATAEAAMKEKKVYDYVHGEDGYFNMIEEYPDIKLK